MGQVGEGANCSGLWLESQFLPGTQLEVPAPVAVLWSRDHPHPILLFSHMTLTGGLRGPRHYPTIEI